MLSGHSRAEGSVLANVTVMTVCRQSTVNAVIVVPSSQSVPRNHSSTQLYPQSVERPRLSGCPVSVCSIRSVSPVPFVVVVLVIESNPNGVECSVFCIQLIPDPHVGCVVEDLHELSSFDSTFLYSIVELKSSEHDELVTVVLVHLLVRCI